MFRKLLEWLFPTHCAGCGKSGTALCATCFDKIPKAEPHTDENIHSVFSYRHPPLRRLIWELKFKGRYTVAFLFGEVLADTALSVLEDEVFFGESKEIVVHY
jgi:predicted amidophosphoribosyltransferase